MACYSPIQAYQPISGGRLEFVERPDTRPLMIPCGQCVGCRLERSRQWAIRCMHEASLYSCNAFVTLTYDDKSLPVDKSLRYRDFQRFMRTLRQRIKRARQRKLSPDGRQLRQDVFNSTRDSERSQSSNKIRFYMCGEYGENTGRPHYHACLFNVHFADSVILKRSASGMNLYTSKLLSDCWPHGFACFGDVTFESAAYVARYVMKKIYGDAADEHYKRVDENGEFYWLRPEFTKMSLKPGIGAGWFDQFHKDVYPRDYVVVRGLKMKPPKYYDKLFEKIDGFEMEYIEFLRGEKFLDHAGDATPERLRVREKVAKAKLNLKRRS